MIESGAQLRKVKVLLSASSYDPIVKEAERLEGGTHAKETESKIDYGS